jgi:hypothetical protein
MFVVHSIDCDLDDDCSCARLIFDPSCEFLLTQNNHESLFEPAVSGGEIDYRCKGCREITKRWLRENHWMDHRHSLEKQQEARREAVKAERLSALARGREARRIAKEAA